CFNNPSSCPSQSGEGNNLIAPLFPLGQGGCARNDLVRTRGRGAHVLANGDSGFGWPVLGWANPVITEERGGRDGGGQVRAERTHPPGALTVPGRDAAGQRSRGSRLLAAPTEMTRCLRFSTSCKAASGGFRRVVVLGRWVLWEGCGWHCGSRCWAAAA